MGATTCMRRFFARTRAFFERPARTNPVPPVAAIAGTSTSRPH